MEHGCKRVYLVWHRRSGKDAVCMHRTAIAAHEKVATYWHMLPQANQARKAIWDAVNPDTGKRRIDEAFPIPIRASTRENDMLIRFRNGSTWQVVGSDNYKDALIGGSPAGVVFSEFATSDPDAWAIGISPILLENGGWAIFNTTPNGRNHAKKLFDAVRHDPEWFVELLTIEDTGRVSKEVIEKERQRLTAERGARDANAIIDQEYYCSWDAAIPGSIYGPEMKAAEESGRVLDLPYDQRLPVTTAWDLGGNDPTSIVFCQQSGQWLDIIDHIRESNQTFSNLQRQLYNFREYGYRVHLFPHDGNQRQQSADLGTSFLTAKRAGISPIRIVPRSSEAMQIRAVKSLFPRFRFDRARTADLRDALANYQYEWDDGLQRFREQPRHDWASHDSKALGYLAQGMKTVDSTGQPPRPQTADLDYPVFG